jgi:hypothetical protein
MGELQSIKNKVLIMDCFIFLLFYTNTTISEFKLLDIKFILKEEYIISNFNTLFEIVWLYYIFLFVSHYVSHINEIIVLENKDILKQLSNKKGGIYKFFSLAIYLTSFRFLNIHLPFIITFIVLYSVMHFEIYSLIAGVITFIIINLLGKELIKPFNKEALILATETKDIQKNYEKLVKNINILKDTNDIKIVKIFEEVEKTISRRIERNQSKQKELQKRMGLN